MSRTPVVQNLRQEAENARRLLAQLDSILGDDAEARADAVEGETQLCEAVDRVLARLAEIEALQEAIKTQKADLTARAARLKAQAEALRASTLDALEAAGVPKFERPLATVSVANVPRGLDITNEALIPSRFWVTPDPVLDKARLKEALESGEIIEGAQLDNGGRTLKVRPR